MSSEWVERKEEVMSDDGFFQRVHETVTVRLKRCPFCGHPAKTEGVNTEDGTDFMTVKCLACGISTKLSPDYEEAANFWNRRVKLHPESRKGAARCPFCGSKASYEYADAEADREDAGKMRAECEGCGAHTEYYADGKEALLRWNRRM